MLTRQNLDENNNKKALIMITTLLLSTLTGAATGVVMALPFTRKPAAAGVWRKRLCAAKATLFASLVLFGGMLYSLSFGFASDDLRAHAITGVVAYLTFSSVYVLSATGQLTRARKALLARCFTMIDDGCRKSPRFNRFCLRVEASKLEYRQIKARKAS